MDGIFCESAESVFYHRFQTDCGPALSQMGTENSVLGVKAAQHEADNSPPCTDEVKIAWSHT
jgi:hypothetical protein